MKRLILLLLTFVLGLGAGLLFYIRQELRTPGNPAQGLILEIPRGLGTREVVRLLEEKNVIRNRYAALIYIGYSGTRNRLQAGEYLFDRPQTIPEVVNKLATGAVYLHKFTVPEGLTLEGIAQKWQEQGFGKAEEFVAAAGGSVDHVRAFDAEATSVEGYLFPETYSFPSHTTADQVVDAMISRFRQMVDKLQQAIPSGSWPLKLRDAVILASLVESEAAHADERPVIASVYLNRLRRRILLQCDPTVIYALQQEHKYRGSLTLADLKFKSPYNTYMNVGLPPGPITNPGYASLLAALQPAITNYLFFVRTDAGRHTFSETLAAHNRAVAAYRKLLRPSPERVRRRGE
ncbi:MAG TPA: endolytic transglycosylase MltG [Terriglobia bacterium]|nr:endolytic transglycosylase MltG [Terriglobia bacterium]